MQHERLSISEAYELFRLDYIVMKNFSKKTEELYTGAMKLLIRFMGDIDVTTIKFSDVRDFRNWLATWQKPDTVRGYVICVRMLLKFLRWRHYSVLDYEEIPVSKREKRVVQFLTMKEVEDFIYEVGKPRRGYAKINRVRNVAIVTLLYATGLRNGELCSLDRNSIKDRAFTVVGKSKNPRIGFINKQAEDAINAYLALRNDTNKALFISPQTGQRITTGTLRRIFQFTCDRSDFENVHPHTIRHSYATYMLEKKVDLRYIGDLMGHMSLDTTKMYTHYSNPQLHDIYDNAQAY